jgi:sugar fermentation stimulation protein A
MKYKNTRQGKFISRPNRFIANVKVGGETVVCHVKNTGRCRELLLPDSTVILDYPSSPNRKTPCDLIAVYKGDKLINMDSQAPNKVIGEWLASGGLSKGITLIKPECTYKNSRFDFYIEADGKKIFAEVKGVTLEESGVVLFPDAPTERGVKHIGELIDAVKNGYEAYIFFVIQMRDCLYFAPNEKMHPEFAEALRLAKESGVNIRALNCAVGEDEMSIIGDVEVRLYE